LDQQGIPYLRYEHATRIAKELQKNNEQGLFTVYNRADWGFPDANIKDDHVVVLNAAPRGPRTYNQGRLDEVVERVVLADIPLEAAIPHAGSRAIAQLSLDGLVDHVVVRTAPEMWSYSLMFDVSKSVGGAGEFWISVEICVDFGTVYLGVLNRAQDDFLVQAACSGPTADCVEMRIFVRDSTQIGEVVFRNGDAGGTTQFRIRKIRLLGEAVTEELAAVSPALPKQSPEELMRNLAFAEEQRLRLAEALAALHLESATAQGQPGEGTSAAVVG
jgi:hypothetical protein